MGSPTIAGVKYATGKIDAIKQFHVFLKIAPLLASFIKLRISSNDPLKAGEDQDERNKQTGANVDAFAMALSRIPKEDVDFILATCLVACQRPVGAGWVAVWVEGGGLTDQNMPLMTMLQLVWSVLEENLQSFFDSAASILGSWVATPKK